MEGNAVLNKWTKRALSASEKKANGSSHQNRKTAGEKPPPENSTHLVKKGKKPRAKKTEQKAEQDKMKLAQKKERSNTVDSQSNKIGKGINLEMKLLLHGANNTGTPAEFTISVAPEMTFEGLKNKIAQTTRISPDMLLLIVKGKEWQMEKQAQICDMWSTDDLVAIFEKDALSSGEYRMKCNKIWKLFESLFMVPKYNIIIRIQWVLIQYKRRQKTLALWLIVNQI